jgi:hypothetical protein
MNSVEGCFLRYYRGYKVIMIGWGKTLVIGMCLGLDQVSLLSIVSFVI